MTDFRDLPDLASEAVGGRAILCSDDSFASQDHLVCAAAPESRDPAYRGRGKGMDGWETRRYRSSDGVAPASGSDVHDWCIVRLGMPGAIRGVVIDTAFVRDDCPETVAVDGAVIHQPLDLAAIDSASWVSLVPRSSIRSDCANAFAVASDQRWTHVRLAIYPDGGIARMRVHGKSIPDRDRWHSHLIDLAALENGATVEACSGGPGMNLLSAGPARSMADGWETPRRRGAGNDWAIISLASLGSIERLELDTSHFAGNAPARVVVEGSVEGGDRAQWRTLLATPLQPNTRHVFDRTPHSLPGSTAHLGIAGVIDSDLRCIGDVAYLRLSIFPCGGLARLRAWGSVLAPADAGLAKLNAMTPLEATAALLRCCRSSNWAAAMTAARPYCDAHALGRAAERTWFALGEADYLEAFTGHPRIGELRSSSPTGPLSVPDPTGAAAEIARAALAEANKAYEAKHGFIFIACASGKTNDALLAELLARFERSRPDELRTAAEEQAKIIRLRISRLLQELA